MSETRSGETVSAQIGKMGAIDNLNNADFSCRTVNASTSRMTARNP